MSLVCFVKKLWILGTTPWSRNEEQGTRNKEHRTRSEEQGERNKEQGIRNKEQGTQIVLGVDTGNNDL